jgi:hypothetical protein
MNITDPLRRLNAYAMDLEGLTIDLRISVMDSPESKYLLKTSARG